MISDIERIAAAAKQKAINAITLLEASLEKLPPYKVDKHYSPEESEPFDALSDRFVRAVEICIKYFKSYERKQYAESSDSFRDLLNRMHKLEMITSVEMWFRMRDVRNRIVHDYLPGEIKDLYDSIMGEMGSELLTLADKLKSMP